MDAGTEGTMQWKQYEYQRMHLRNLLKYHEPAHQRFLEFSRGILWCADSYCFHFDTTAMGL